MGCESICGETVSRTTAWFVIAWVLLSYRTSQGGQGGEGSRGPQHPAFRAELVSPDAAVHSEWCHGPHATPFKTSCTHLARNDRGPRCPHSISSPLFSLCLPRLTNSDLEFVLGFVCMGVCGEYMVSTCAHLHLALGGHQMSCSIYPSP